MTSQCNTRGLTRIEVVVVLVVGLFALSLLTVVWRRARSDAARTTCAANLAAIGKAMLAYANDHNGGLPRAGGPSTAWGVTPQWAATNRYAAYGLAADGRGGSATISSCLYLLVKYMGVPPKKFVCPGDKGITEFKLSEERFVRERFTLADGWDFGWEPASHCSYAYQMPFGVFALKTTDDPRSPVAADPNPWLQSPTGEPRSLARFRPDLPPYGGTPEQAREGNTFSHGRDGQNVLFLDGHVKFAERSCCGLDNDNIYLVSNDLNAASPIGMIPVLPDAIPTNRLDSVLTQDLPMSGTVAYVEDRTSEVVKVDSKDLQRTAVVATLDCPLPEHKNVIWCATFQMAWDKLRQDVVREPIQLPEARDLAGRLNQDTYPTGDIEARSYYAAAGFIKNGIIEQVQREMKQRFPTEPVPSFDERYRTLPDTILAYGYLQVDVGFEQPYYTYPGKFDFRDSNGLRTPVTAFSTQSSAHGSNYEKVRDQVEILYYEYGDKPDTAQFAVDLCKQTQPYQVVLACVPRCNTLGEAAKTLREKTAAFKNDDDYAVLHKLRPIDCLVVPDVVYRLKHHFQELLGRYFGNQKLSGHFIFEALQEIDFTLSRTGVVLRSAAQFGGTAGRAPAQLAQPRHLHFDRPFLICVQKREPDATPFFLMWVDNAELMQPYDSRERP